MASRDNEPLVYRLHAGAKQSAVVMGILLAVLVIPLPIALLCFVAAWRGKLVLREHEVATTFVFTKRILFSDVDRLGLLRVPVAGMGIGAFLARKKCGGGEGVNLCLMDRRGKTRSILVSMYESHEDILEGMRQLVGKPYEQVVLGAWSLKWPERKLQ